MPSLSRTRHNASAAPVPFGTKAETLERLLGRLTQATIQPLLHFTVNGWRANREATLREIEARGWLTVPLAVRSSARSEDGQAASLAGKYQSRLAVLGKAAFIDAVESVIASYGKAAAGDQVLVQPMVPNVRSSGVAFGRDPNTGSAYRVISIDDKSGRTDTVTGGSTKEIRTFYSFARSEHPAPELIAPVLRLIDELEALFGTDRMDVEFAIDAAGTVYLLQCRPLILDGATGEMDVAELTECLRDVEAKFRTLSRRNPYLCGNATIFGVMPDWNPAEIIGIRPSPLALSLYRELITDAIWAYQRNNYGYRNLRSFPLLVDFYGLPYIDVRVDFNSFVPGSLDELLAEKLVNHYLKTLVASPSLHDKVEFEIVLTCYSLDTPERIERLKTFGFSDVDCRRLTDSLRELTNDIIHPDFGLWKKDIEKIRALEGRLDAVKKSELDTVGKIYWILEDCKRYGTLPFAGLARAGFIAIQLLKSLVKIGVLSTRDYDEFLGSLDTVSSQMSRDFATLRREAFLEKYGHLRPGTYDLLCPRYDEEPDRYFDWSRKEVSGRHAKPFSLTLDQMNAIDAELKRHGIEHNVLGFFDFIKRAIEGREHSKFVFTRSLSDALSLFKGWTGELGFAPQDAAFASIGVIYRLYSSAGNERQHLEESIAVGKQRFERTRRIVLPPLLFQPEDIWSFEVPATEPNFVTQGHVTGKPMKTTEEMAKLKGAIAFIPGADPGFDWLFSHGIGGLVTMYGGINSHMAIRAGELNIPAVIGAGEVLYRQWETAQLLEIDCAQRQVRVLK